MTIRDARLEDVPSGHVHKWGRQSSYRTLTSLLPNANVLNNIVHLAEGNSPVDLASEMYPGLLRYARSLERHKHFKIDMETADWQQPSGRYRQGYVLNPFKTGNTAHPVEEGLGNAAFLVEAQDIMQFKHIRNNVLQYLEPQYQRIMAASLNITDFIKREKRPNGFFDCTIHTSFDPYAPDYFDTSVAAEGYLLLQQYVESFRRDVPFPIQIQMKRNDLFNLTYYDADREGCLADMLRATHLEDAVHAISLFKRAFHNMEVQRLEIREARKVLFIYNHANQPGTDIDPELRRCDDLVCFDVNEPDFDVSET